MVMNAAGGENRGDRRPRLVLVVNNSALRRPLPAPVRYLAPPCGSATYHEEAIREDQDARAQRFTASLVRP
jgi:hypothetical protein